MSFKNIAERQGRGVHALENLPGAHKLQYTRITEQFVKADEGDRFFKIKVVENARNLGDDLI